VVGHRAEPGLLEAPSTTPRGKRCADVPVDSLPIEAFTEAPYVGRRRASVTAAAVQAAPLDGPLVVSPALPLSPGRTETTDSPVHRDFDTGTIERVLSALEPVDHTTSFEHEPTARLPLLRAEAPATATGGKRRAPKRTGRGPLLRAVPSVPVLAGVATLAVAVSGAVLVDGSGQADESHDTVHAASALSGTSGQGKVGVRTKPTTRSEDRSAGAVDGGASALGGTATSEQDQRAAADALAQTRSGKLEAQAQTEDAWAKQVAKNVWQYPLEPVVLTARFGQYGLWASYHTGLDFNGNTGDPIKAIANGTVTSTGYDGSYGNKTVVELEDGTELWYCHQSAIDVSVGDTVRAGEVIGLVGATGHVTGSHLHVEVRPGGGDPVDPYTAMQQHGLFRD
jgi:murein DD-endopeptidase MepM/ murein hydrolase activator NlpD